MAGVIYAAEVAREDAMGGSYVEMAWTREELAAAMRVEWPSIAPGTRVDYYALPYEVGFGSHPEASAWADEQIHDGAEPVASVWVTEPAKAADNVVAFEVEFDAQAWDDADGATRNAWASEVADAIAATTPHAATVTHMVPDGDVPDPDDDADEAEGVAR